MIKNRIKISLISGVLALGFVGSASVMALPSQAKVNAATSTATSSSSSNSSHLPTQASTNKAKAAANQAAAKLKACQNRQTAINNIINRIDTRAQNQLTLFSTIASRVETFYTSQGKTLSNYSSLVSAVTRAQITATSGLSAQKGGSTINCSATHPKAMVQAFQQDLKLEITYLKNFKTAVKNLIVGVASANGVKLSTTSSTQGGN